MKSEKDYYQILGIQRNASLEDIRRAYRLYASKLHPDKHDGDTFFEERFKELIEAYETLSDENKKTAYDLRTFRKGKVVRRHRFDDKNNRNATTGKLKFEVSHLDIYVTLFYLVNLSAWIIFRRLNSSASTGGLVLSLFLCGISTLMMWIFVTKLMEFRNQNDNDRRPFPVGYLLISLLIGSIPLITNWIP